MENTKNLSMKLPIWVYEEAGLETAPNKSGRVEELMLKGLMLERERGLNRQINKSKTAQFFQYILPDFIDGLRISQHNPMNTSLYY